MGAPSIVIAEDEPVVALDLKDRLIELGYDVTAVVSSGARAVEKTLELRPDLVLMDIRLQGDVDGIEAANRIHQTLDTPIVFLTAYGDEDTLARVKADHSSGYLIKPYDERELNVAISTATRRHEVVERLKHGQEWLASVLRALGDGALASDAGGAIRFMNPIAERLTGWSKEEAVGLPLERVLRLEGGAPQEPNDWLTPRRRNLIAKDGSQHAVEAETTLLRNDAGASMGVVWVLRDISERRRLEEGQRLLMEAGSLVSLCVDAPPSLDNIARVAVSGFADWCVVDRIDGGGVVHSVFGSRSEPHVVQDRRRLDDLSGFVRAAVNACQTRIAGSVAISDLTRGIGEARPGEALARTTICAQLAARGHCLGAITLAWEQYPGRGDAFDVGLAEELGRRIGGALDNFALYEQAQRALRLRDEFLAIASHDLKSPLAAIVLSTDLLSRTSDSTPSETVRHQAGTMRRSAMRMARLIDDLLDLARIDAGRLPIEPHRWPAHALVKEAVEQLEPLATQRSQNLKVEVGPGDATVWCDRERVVQLLSNVLGNAIKFTPEGGSIEVRVEQPGRDEVRFSVSDNGPGIEKDHLAHVFERSWQAPAARSSGSGLGLYIAKGIADAHGGRIWVQSSSDEGTTVRFALPAVAPTGNHVGAS